MANAATSDLAIVSDDVSDDLSDGVSDGPRWRPSNLTSLAVTIGLLAAIGAMAITGRPGQLGEAVNREFEAWWPFFVSVQFLVLTPAIFLAEYLRPARPEQRGISPNVVFDAFYFAVHLPTIVAIAALLSGPINDYLEANAAWLVLDSTTDWPVWLMGLLGLAIADFGAWFSHLLKHKIPLLWRFHMIHHSQPRMSLFTSNRTHPFDALVDVFVLLLPFFILFPSFTAQAGNVFVVGLAKGWLERAEHANIRTNLGPLRWLFVTPQSHRIHHSTEPDHWNSNYATFFAWDRLFGTQHADVTSYPTTGINDPDFPEPKTWSPGEFARSFVGQMLFPFDGAAVRRASTGSPNDPVDSTV
jgi:sterol desaturase/sphingolipid hydroxylase (fatty acid hydroxylase superfamily)